MKTSNSLSTLSLFSGAGGLDLGFEMAGFDIIACVELEAAYCATLVHNIENGTHFSKRTKIHCQDIRDFDPTPYNDLGIQCVIGGPPCQTFSAAGRRSGGVIGTEDGRGQLYNAYCDILDAIDPEVFIFENVYGLPSANGGSPWREIVSAFQSRGYRLFYEVVDAADYGIPQHRERLILVGTKKGEFKFPLPTHGPDSQTGNSLVSVKEAISDLQEIDEPYHNDLGGLYGHLLSEVPEGLNYAYFTAEMGHPQPAFAWRSKFHDLLYKVNRDEPCRTIKAQPGKFTGPFHWKNRHFTVKELKRLQTFPDDYAIVGSYGKVLEQIGNSVPPRLAYVIATAVREQLLTATRTQTFHTRSRDFSSTFRSRQRERSKKFKKIAAVAIQHRYGASTFTTPSLGDAEKGEIYHVKYKGLFHRERTERRSNGASTSASVKISEIGSNIKVSFSSNIHSIDEIGAKIRITGLRRYLPRYDTLSLSGKLNDHADLFHVWQEIEEILVARSRFFSLIDIYGHYANRGDVVQIKSTFNFSKVGPFERMIQFFSQTENCGDFYSEDSILEVMNIGHCDVSAVVRKMRGLRFDLRTSSTHPIIGPRRILGTYPFPLLSPRALVESRVILNVNANTSPMTGN